ARGFEFHTHEPTCNAVTAVEVMEHLTEPLAFVDEVLGKSRSDTLIFTTELYFGKPPDLSWWYYSFATGQHIGFFTRKSLEVIGNKLGLSFISAGGMHILSRREFSERKL